MYEREPRRRVTRPQETFLQGTTHEALTPVVAESTLLTRMAPSATPAVNDPEFT